MKALVTGGAGLIGSHIVEQLLEKGYDVRILDNLEPETHPQGKPSWIPEQAEFMLGDMKSKDDVVRALDGVDVVFHQAAYGGFAPEITKYVATNSLGTAYIFDAIRENNFPIKKIVTASSQGVYGEGAYTCPTHGMVHPTSRPLSQLESASWEVKCPTCGVDMQPANTPETKPVDPGVIYSITKYSQEMMTLRLGAAMGIPTVALRYSLTYGPHQSIFNPYTGITSIFSTRILNDLPPIVYEDGNQMRDFVFVEDVARANIHVMEDDRANYQVFNVGSGKGTTVFDFIQTLAGVYGREVTPKITGQFRPGEVRHLFSDNSKLRALGWEPTHTLQQGLAKYVEWIKTQGEVKEYFSEALKIMEQRGVVRNVKK